MSWTENPLPSIKLLKSTCAIKLSPEKRLIKRATGWYTLQRYVIINIEIVLKENIAIETLFLIVISYFAKYEPHK